MSDISAFGLRVHIRASNTFPIGFVGTEFADDADPFDMPSIQIKDKAMSLNGDMVSWSTANPLLITLNVIPSSEFDENLSILLESNRVGKGKNSSRDVITMTAIYPDGSTLILSKGALTDGPPASSAASSGRLKSNAYQFAFENMVRS
jgi:hypothetical protein